MNRSALIIFLLILVTGSALGQQYHLRMLNETQVAPNIYQYDIYLQQDPAAVWADYTWGQYVIEFNTAIKPTGAYLYYTFVAGSSQLTNAAQAPVQSKFSIGTGTASNQLRIAGGSPPGAGSGSIISTTYPGTRIITCRILCTSAASGGGTAVPFAQVTPNLTWRVPPATSPSTQISGYVSGIATNVTLAPYGGLTYGPATNPVLNQPSTPLAGTYTVGTGKTYTSLVEAFNDANTLGLSANVIFNIETDITQTGQAVLNQWTETGTGGYTITIKPNGGAARTITCAVPADQAIVKLAGADRVTIDGLNTGSNSLAFVNSGANANTACLWLASQGANLGCNDVTVQNLTLTGNGNETDSYGLFAGGTTLSSSGEGVDNDGLTVAANTIRNAKIGVYAVGSAGTPNTLLSLTNNAIGDATYGIKGIGVMLGNVTSPLVTGNTIAGVTTGSAIQKQIGIYLAAGTSGATVKKNKIHDFTVTGTTGHGGNGIRFDGDATASSEFSNNLIWNIGGDGNVITGTDFTTIPVGICVTMGGNINIWHNSVCLSGTLGNAGLGTSAGILFASGVTGCDVRNNIFQNSMTGSVAGSATYGIVFQGTSTAPVSALDNNVYFVNGSTNVVASLGRLNGSDHPTLPGWQTATGRDANSAVGDPRFESPSNLMINTTVDPVPMGSNLGAPLAGVTTDFVGTLRSLIHPDAGAYEFDVTRSFSGSGTFTVGGGGVIDDLSITNTNATVNMTGSTQVGGTLTLTGGQLNLAGNALTLFGGLTLSGGTLNSAPGSTLVIADPPAGPAPAFQMPDLTLHNLVINRAAGISQIADLTLNGMLTFTSGSLRPGSHNFTFGPTALTGGTPGPTSMIVADGTGEVRKQFGATGSFTFPVGDETGTTDYSPITLNFQTGSFTGSTWAGVRVVDAKHPSNPSTTSFITRYWSLTTNMSGFTCDIQSTYLPGDVTGTGSLYTAKFDGTGWTSGEPATSMTQSLSFPGATSFSDISATTKEAAGAKLVVKTAAIIEGAWNGASAMKTDLAALAGFPLTQPYSNPLKWNYAGTETVTTLPANVVDWVLVELRDAATHLTVLERRAGFLLTNGDVVDLDGDSPLCFKSTAPGSYFIVIWQRNHIPIMSAFAQPLSLSSAKYDFTTAQAQAYGTAPMRQVGTTYFALYGGDANGDGQIDVTDFVDADNNQFADGYLQFDTNADGFIDSQDFMSTDNNNLIQKQF